MSPAHRHGGAQRTRRRAPAAPAGRRPPVRPAPVRPGPSARSGLVPGPAGARLATRCRWRREPASPAARRRVRAPAPGPAWSARHPGCHARRCVAVAPVPRVADASNFSRGRRDASSGSRRSSSSMQSAGAFQLARRDESGQPAAPCARAAATARRWRIRPARRWDSRRRAGMRRRSARFPRSATAPGRACRGCGQSAARCAPSPEHRSGCRAICVGVARYSASTCSCSGVSSQGSSTSRVCRVRRAGETSTRSGARPRFVHHLPHGGGGVAAAFVQRPVAVGQLVVVPGRLGVAQEQ